MSTLTDLFAGIADAIRNKTENTATITASNFPTEIVNIPESTNAFYEPLTYNDVQTLKSYLTRVKNVSIESFRTSLSSMFSSFPVLEEVGLSNISHVVNMSSMFYNCVSLTTAALSNTVNVTNMSNMFRGCTSLVTALQFDTSHVETMQLMFGGCSSLAIVPQFNTSNVTTMNNMFINCTSLTATSLNNILGMCAASRSSSKVLTTLGIHTSDYPSIDFTALPNYQAFIDAGWRLS